METTISKKAKTLIFVCTKILLSFIAFYIISKRITINPLVYFTGNTINYFLIAMLFSFLLLSLQAWRWKNIVKIYSINLTYLTSLIAVWAGHFINNILPTATAGDLLRSYTLRYSNTERKWKWLSAFLFEKYSAATSALLIASLSLLTPIAGRLPALLSLMIFALLIFLLFIPVLAIRILPSSFVLLHKINTLLSQTLLNKNGRRVFINSLFINLTICIMFYLIAISLNAPISFIDCLFVVPVFTILASLPISYAGWGVRELSCVELLQFFGVNPEMAVIISIMYGLLLLFSSVPGLLVVYHFIVSRKKLSLHAEQDDIADAATT